MLSLGMTVWPACPGGAPLLRLRMGGGRRSPLAHLDRAAGPGPVPRHGALAELVEDGGGLRPHVVVGPQVERAHHGLAVMLAEQRLLVRLAAHPPGGAGGRG